MCVQDKPAGRLATSKNSETGDTYGEPRARAERGQRQRRSAERGGGLTLRGGGGDRTSIRGTATASEWKPSVHTHGFAGTCTGRRRSSARPETIMDTRIARRCAESEARGSSRVLFFVAAVP